MSDDDETPLRILRERGSTPGDTVEIDGVKATVVSEEDAENADAYFCVRKGAPTPFTDNVEGECSLCGHTVIHRPHGPTKPRKICIECAIEIINSEEEPN